MQEDRNRWRQSDLHKQAQAHELKQRFARYLKSPSQKSDALRKDDAPRLGAAVRWFALAAVALWLVWRVFGR